MSMDLPLVIVVAMGRNRAIGFKNAMPWHLRSDLKHFKNLTLGKPMLMGRKTYLSIGKPLPGRETIVLTRDPGFKPPQGVYVAASLEAARALGVERANAMGAREVIVAGGADLYAQTLPLAARLHVTLVDAEPEADAFFPELPPGRFMMLERTMHTPGPEDDHAFETQTLVARS